MTDDELRSRLLRDMYAAGVVSNYDVSAAHQARAQQAANYLAQPMKEMVVERIVEKKVLPTIAELARALFETDPEVTRFCASVDDAMPPATLSIAERVKAQEEASRRWARARQIAWERDEGGFRSRALDRAEAVSDRLKGDDK